MGSSFSQVSLLFFASSPSPSPSSSDDRHLLISSLNGGTNWGSLLEVDAARAGAPFVCPLPPPLFFPPFPLRLDGCSPVFAASPYARHRSLSDQDLAKCNSLSVRDTRGGTPCPKNVGISGKRKTGVLPPTLFCFAFFLSPREGRRN